ncbi:uncharacterized protein TNCV_1314271 [Trichonephila clavipes]|nr:uncharacterized protein TNCV_1314271 [Trichonephila clavipes]
MRAFGDGPRNFQAWSSDEGDMSWSPLLTTTLPQRRGCGSPVVKVSNHGRHVGSSIQVPLKTRVGQRCTLNLSRAETSSRWCGVVVRRGVPAQVSSTSLDHGSKITWSVAKSPRVAEQCDVNINSTQLPNGGRLSSLRGRGSRVV